MIRFSAVPRIRGGHPEKEEIPMKRMTLRAAACALCLAACIPAMSVAIEPCPTRMPAPTPTAEIINNSAWFKHEDPIQSTFQLNEAISREFTAFAVVVLPDGTMLNALTLDAPPKPVAANLPGLNAPFSYPLIKTYIPGAAPLGGYEVLAGFFDPKKPITGKSDAFLLASGPFTIVTVIPSPIPDISGPWTGIYKVTAPVPCDDGTHDGTWNSCVQMAPDGTLSGYFESSGGTSGDISGAYDGTTATWTVEGAGGVSYSGQVQTSGMTISGTFSKGPRCGDGERVSGTFTGVKE
jgi:hypothetical protein